MFTATAMAMISNMAKAMAAWTCKKEVSVPSPGRPAVDNKRTHNRKGGPGEKTSSESGRRPEKILPYSPASQYWLKRLSQISSSRQGA